MKTKLQEKEIIHQNITTWFTNLFLCLKPWKFLQQKQRWTRNGKNWRKLQRGIWRKSEVRKMWLMKQGRRAQSSFCIVKCHMSFEKCWVGGKAPKIQRSSCTPRWYCKRRLRVLCSICRQSQVDIVWSEDHCAPLDEVAAEDLSYIATAVERGRRENTRGLVLKSSGPNGSMQQREDSQEAKRIKNVYIKNHLAKLTTDFIDQTNNLLGTTKVWSASTQRQAWSCTTLSQQQALLPRDSHRVRGGSLLHGPLHQNGVSVEAGTIAGGECDAERRKWASREYGFPQLTVPGGFRFWAYWVLQW